MHDKLTSELTSVRASRRGFDGELAKPGFARGANPHRGYAKSGRLRWRRKDGDKANLGGYAIDAAERDVELEPPVKVTLQEFKLGRPTDDVKLSGAFTVAGHHGKLSGSGTLLACP